MSDHATNMDRLFDLAGMICDDIASSDEFIELDSIVRADGAAREWYLCYCRTHISLRLELRANLATQAVYQQIGIEPPAAGSSELQIPGNGTRPVLPAPTFPAPLFQGTLEHLTSGWPMAYLVATVIFGIGALIGSFTYVSHYEEVADTSPPRGATHILESQHESESVGQITGMGDCKWAGAAVGSARVSLGQKYELASGLMEITYDTGARVILQGPVTYTVESKNGGFMAIGKLTGKVTTASAKGFSVRTPTATVIDLGTEFGVEVTPDGNSAIQVFRGLVSIAPGPIGRVGQTRRLLAGEAMWVKRAGKNGSLNVMNVAPGMMGQFIRDMRSFDAGAYMKSVLADTPLLYWTFNEPCGPAFDQVRHLAMHSLRPMGGASRCDHAAIGSGIVLGRAADFSQAAGCFTSRMTTELGTMSGAWAIEFWVQATGDRDNGPTQYLLNAGVGMRYGPHNPAVVIESDADRKNELRLCGYGSGRTHGGMALTDNRWHHVLLAFYGNGSWFGVAHRVDMVFDGGTEDHRPR